MQAGGPAFCGFSVLHHSAGALLFTEKSVLFVALRSKGGIRIAVHAKLTPMGNETMKKTIFALVFVVTGMYAQTADTRFILDETKPYVYLKFDHVGPRKPLQAGEGSQGLWLRIVNNCKVPIGVKTYGVTSGDPGAGVFDEVIPIKQGFSVQADSAEIPLAQEKSQPPVQKKNKKQRIPQGYSAELSSVTRVLPGQSLLFSVPRNHVSRDWFMRVKFILDVNKPSVGSGPLTELDFFNEQIPVKSASQ